MIFARKLFFPEFWGTSAPSPVSYAYGTVNVFTDRIKCSLVHRCGRHSRDRRRRDILAEYIDRWRIEIHWLHRNLSHS